MEGNAVFVLLGCASGDAATCSTLLDTASAEITQTLIPVAAIGEIPEEPVFVPEEEVRITVDNPGGGRMMARGQELVNHAEQVFSGYPEDVYHVNVPVRRCSALSSASIHCEPPVASDAYDFIGPDTAYVVPDDRSLTLDPAWHTSTTEVLVYSDYRVHDLEWSLFDAGGDQVVGPVGVTDSSTSLVDIFDFSIGAALEDTSLELPDGAYTARFTATFAKGELVKATSEDEVFQVTNDPPADDPQVLAVQRDIRPNTQWGSGEARFTVHAYPGSGLPGQVRLRNAAGTVVRTESVSNPFCSWCPDPKAWRVHIDGWRDSGEPLRPGRYSAELEMPDSYGRIMVKQLGGVVVEREARVTKTVTATAVDARHGPPLVGRCSRTRSPGERGWRESVALLSGVKCSSRRGNDDVVRRDFQLRLPKVYGYEAVATVSPQLYAGGRGAYASTATRLTGTQQRWDGGPLLGRRVRWHDVGMLVPSQQAGVDLSGRPLQIRVRVADGGRFDIGKVRLSVTYWAWRPPRA